MTALLHDHDTDAHLLRLCLDLQLDALLLTLGAAAAQRVRDVDDSPWPPSDTLPWRRWVDEDVELAATLAADAMAGHAALPSTLGNEVAHQVPATVIDDLTARFESMRVMLTELLGRDADTGDPWVRVPAGGDWRPQIRPALARCLARLDELSDLRLHETPPRGVPVGAPTMPAGASPLAAEHRYLPGELLG